MIQSTETLDLASTHLRSGIDGCDRLRLNWLNLHILAVCSTLCCWEQSNSEKRSKPRLLTIHVWNIFGEETASSWPLITEAFFDRFKKSPSHSYGMKTVYRLHQLSSFLDDIPTYPHVWRVNPQFHQDSGFMDYDNPEYIKGSTTPEWIINQPWTINLICRWYGFFFF